MIVTAWNDGAHHESGAGYGFKVKRRDRDVFFNREWDCVVLDLPGYPKQVRVNVNKASFWHKCRELISKDIGLWLGQMGQRQWPKGVPPHFILEHQMGNCFRIRLIT